MILVLVISGLYMFFAMCYRMLSGAQNTFVYRHVHQNGTLDVKHNIQVLHLTPVSDVYQAGQNQNWMNKWMWSVCLGPGKL